MCNWVFLWVTDKKVQLNTDLLKQRAQVFIHKANGWLKLNEIKGIKILTKSPNENGGFKLGTVFNLQMAGGKTRTDNF